MSRETRFDKLEGEIVDALRRAPGVDPSADLDARILARAHATVAKPLRRPQPVWFSMAAGLVVLVGTGLALRISEQVGRAPTALDVPAPTASAPTAVVEKSTGADEGAAVADAAGESSERASPKREQAAPTPEQRMSTQPGAQLRQETMAAEAKLDALSAAGARAPAADTVMPSVAPAPRPFPAEPKPAVRSQEAAPFASGIAAPATPAAAPAVSAPAPPMSMPAPATADAAAEVSTTLNKASEADRAQSRAGAAPPAGRDLAAPAKPAVDEERARQLDAPIELQRSDAFVLAVVAVREAVARGDTTTALRLANALEHDFPGREIPKDVQALLDAAR